MRKLKVELKLPIDSQERDASVKALRTALILSDCEIISIEQDRFGGWFVRFEALSASAPQG